MIDFQFIESKKSTKAILFILPCMGGNVMVYRYPLREWANEGYGMYLLNPPGHGKSSGIFHFDDTLQILTTEAEKLIQRFGKDIPFIGIGHSGGGSTLLKFFNSKQEINVKKIFLMSPILDTVLSLKSLYEKQKIEEFTNSLKLQNQEILKILSNDLWTNQEFWEKNFLKEKINHLTSKDETSKIELGTFLENIFIPTKTFYDYIASLKKNIEILLPTDDIWFPTQVSIDTALKYKVPYYIIEKGKDHFFRNAWKDISIHISSSLKKIFSNEKKD